MFHWKKFHQWCT